MYVDLAKQEIYGKIEIKLNDLLAARNSDSRPALSSVLRAVTSPASFLHYFPGFHE